MQARLDWQPPVLANNEIRKGVLFVTTSGERGNHARTKVLLLHLENEGPNADAADTSG
jgi:hypothetical protein